jgi:hypothetical protein
VSLCRIFCLRRFGDESSRVGFCLTQNLGFLRKSKVRASFIILGFDFDLHLFGRLGVLVSNICLRRFGDESIGLGFCLTQI